MLLGRVLRTNAVVTNPPMNDGQPGEGEQDDPYQGPGAPYQMMRQVRGGRTARRCHLLPVNGASHSPKWAYIFDLIGDFEREGRRTPQSIQLITNVGTFLIDGYQLDAPSGLYDKLEQEQVLEIVAYDAKRHGPRAPGPWVSSIREVIPPHGARAMAPPDEDSERREEARAA